jgi:hypothetical protein
MGLKAGVDEVVRGTVAAACVVHRPSRPRGIVEVQLYSFFNVGAVWVGSHRHGKETRYSFYRRLGLPQGRSGRVQKISPQQDSIPGPSSP